MSHPPRPHGPRSNGPRRDPSPILFPNGPESGGPGRLQRWVQRIREAFSRDRASTQPPPPRVDPGTVRVPDTDPPHRVTLQMLPGRLEPINPEVIQQEIRFQRTAPGEQAITLGWELGPPPGHVTLDHPSIQPVHARMTFRGKDWTIESLVSDHPVQVNGSILPRSSGPLLLSNGDEVRIGKALFRFLLP